MNLKKYLLYSLVILIFGKCGTTIDLMKRHYRPGYTLLTESYSETKQKMTDTTDVPPLLSSIGHPPLEELPDTLPSAPVDLSDKTEQPEQKTSPDNEKTSVKQNKAPSSSSSLPPSIPPDTLQNNEEKASEEEEGKKDPLYTIMSAISGVIGVGLLTAGLFIPSNNTEDNSRTCCVLGIGSLVTSIFAIIAGIYSLTNNEKLEGLAILGIALGSVIFILFILVILIFTALLSQYSN